MKFFMKSNKHSRNKSIDPSQSPSQQFLPPPLSAPSSLPSILVSKLTFSVTNSNADLEQLGTDKKLPAYESEKDYHLNRLMENYGAGGGFVGGGFGCPKLPSLPPSREKKKKGRDHALPEYQEG